MSTSQHTPPPRDSHRSHIITSLRKELATMSQAAFDAITDLVASDPALERARAAAISETPSCSNLSRAHAEATIARICSSLPDETHPSVSLLVNFYFGYLRPFPDPSETEPLLSLLSYLRDLPTWDVLLAKDSVSGQILGACSGQILEVADIVPSLTLAWNEHTWVADEARGRGIGSALARAFADVARQHGASFVIIEIDNPYLLTADSRGFDHSQVQARRHFWTQEMKHAMDPFDRIAYWASLGFGLLIAERSCLPAPYEQISLDCGKLPSCGSINIAVAPINDEALISLPKDSYARILVALQQTVDHDARCYPELVRTLKQIEEIDDDSLGVLPLTSPQLETFLRRAQTLKAHAHRDDRAYCLRKLSSSSLSVRERFILEQTLTLLGD